MPETWINNGAREIVHENHAGLPLKGISWSAVFVGVIAALIVHILLALLGTAIGATTIDPQQEQNLFQHLGTGALVWTSLNMLVAIAVGSYVSGRLAHQEGALHGLLMFGVSTIIMLWLTILLASSLIGGVFGIIGSSTNALSQSISAFAPSVTNMVKDKLQENDINLDDLQNALQTMLSQSKPELQQDVNMHEQTKNIARNPKHTDADIDNWVRGVINHHYDTLPNDTLPTVDRNVLKNIIKARTSKNDQEVEQIVNQAEQSYQKAMQKFQQLKHQAEQKVRDAAKQAAEITAKMSWYVFFMLVIEAILSAVLGRVSQRIKTHKFLSHK